MAKPDDSGPDLFADQGVGAGSGEGTAQPGGDPGETMPGSEPDPGALKKWIYGTETDKQQARVRLLEWCAAARLRGRLIAAWRGVAQHQLRQQAFNEDMNAQLSDMRQGDGAAGYVPPSPAGANNA